MRNWLLFFCSVNRVVTSLKHIFDVLKLFKLKDLHFSLKPLGLVFRTFGKCQFIIILLMVVVSNGSGPYSYLLAIPSDSAYNSIGHRTPGKTFKLCDNVKFWSCCLPTIPLHHIPYIATRVTDRDNLRKV